MIKGRKGRKVSLFPDDRSCARTHVWGDTDYPPSSDPCDPIRNPEPKRGGVMIGPALAKALAPIFSRSGLECHHGIRSILLNPNKSANVPMARNHSTPFSSHTEVS